MNLQLSDKVICFLFGHNPFRDIDNHLKCVVCKSCIVDKWGIYPHE